MMRSDAATGVLARSLALTCAVLATGVSALPAQTRLDATERRIATWVDDHVEDAIGLLERTVNINSGTLNPEGVRAVGDVLRAELESVGFGARLIDMSAVDRGPHLFGERWESDRGRSLLLIGHLDTVFEKDEAFQTFVRSGDTAVGPGVNDMKGGNVVIIYALKALQAAGALDGTRIIVAFTGDEESPGRPLEISRRDLIDAGQRADVALGFEGAIRDGGQEYGTIARRSASGWMLEVTGRQAHSSGIFRPETGAGAIFEASRILHKFYNAVRGEEYLTFNAGVILGGTVVDYDRTANQGTAFGKTNVVPNRVVVHGGIRTISDDQLQRARQAMRDVVARNLPVTSATITFRDGYPSMPPTEGNRALMQDLSEISEAVGTGPMEPLDPARRGAADISFVAPHVDAALAGLGVYGDGGHTPDEDIDLATLPVAIKRAAILIYRLTR